MQRPFVCISLDCNLGVRGVGFVSGPRLARTGVNEELVHITDWMPTLLYLAGGNSSELDIDGVNQWESISIGSSSPREVSTNQFYLVNLLIV